MKSRHIMIMAIALAAATLAVYWQTTTFGFVNYDDHRYVYENRRVLNGLTRENVAWAFTTYEFSNWHPLTWLSLMLDATLHPADSGARGFHLTNTLLHAANAALVMLLLSRITGGPWRSAIVAMLFALHPLHVESVAWVSARKDVLSTFFGLLAMLAYARYAGPEEGRPGSSGKNRFFPYMLMTLVFALSLMSKPMLVTLPLVLLLLDWWPLDRARSLRDWPRLIAEKTPLLLLSVVSSVLTMQAQQAGGAMRDLAQAPLGQRAGNALVATSEYLRQTIWPADLIMYYPLPQGGWPTHRIVIAAAIVAAISILCAVAARRGNRGPLLGWLWFLGTLVPVLGLVQVGGQAHADRYTYVPLIGVFIMIAWFLPTPAARQLRMMAIVGGAIMAALACVTWVQIGYWRDSATLATRTLHVDVDNLIGRITLGNVLVEQEQYDQAIEQLAHATRIDPRSPQAWHNFGFALAQAGQRDAAIDAYRQAIALRPDMAENHLNLGLLLEAAGSLSAARASIEKAFELASESGDDQVRSRASDALKRMPAN